MNDKLTGSKATSSTTVSQDVWGQADGENAYLYTLTNEQGMQVKLSNWGAYVQSIKVPNRNNLVEDVVVGYDSWDEYYKDCCYAGPIVGRFGNRLNKGQFTIDSKTYQVTRNDGGANKNINQLHGGLKGLHKRMWQSKVITGGVELSYLSVDGEEGYPGNLHIKVRYTLDSQNNFKVSYTATTDKKTPVNLTSHIYFNLTGNMADDIENHVLQISADTFTPVDDLLIPTGKLQPVIGTPFDFTTAKKIGQHIRTQDAQLKKGGGVDTEFGGYDHNWVFSDHDGLMKKQASLYDPSSGRYMEIFTQEPALQFYSGNFMDGTVKGKNAQLIQHRYGLALETQHYPDSPNHANFPNTILAPGETYQTETIYKFSVK
ncbi:aldose epimerase family protein [Catenovulum agarivorans]|uniref:aldose epimerase family protein n=1 Tax=Catenovulum agarivorans TaxID=1172192 RepID=UPI0002EE8857|nr:aldose epimerase family protein [Catenovulum agarivorans]